MELFHIVQHMIQSIGGLFIICEQGGLHYPPEKVWKIIRKMTYKCNTFSDAHFETFVFYMFNNPAAKWHIMTERGIKGYTMFYWLFGIS